MDYAQMLQTLNNIRNQALAIQSQLNAIKASQASGGGGGSTGGGGGRVSTPAAPKYEPQVSLPNMAFSQTTPQFTSLQWSPTPKISLNTEELQRRVGEGLATVSNYITPTVKATQGTAEPASITKAPLFNIVYPQTEVPAQERLSFSLNPLGTGTSTSTGTGAGGGGGTPTTWGGSSATTTLGLGKGGTATGAPSEAITPPPVFSSTGFPMETGSFAGSAAQTAPKPSALPPTPNIPETAIGKYEAMIRALQQQYRNPKYVPLPMVGPSTYGMSAMGNLQRLLQQLQNK